MENPNPWEMRDITEHPQYHAALKLALKQKRTAKMKPRRLAQHIRRIIAEMTGYGENSGARENWPDPESPDAWKDSIRDDCVICLICGVRGQLITEPHLRHHGGTKADYRKHFNIPENVQLASRAFLECRRQSILKSRIWESKKPKASRMGERPLSPDEDLSVLLGTEKISDPFTDMTKDIRDAEHNFFYDDI